MMQFIRSSIVRVFNTVVLSAIVVGLAIFTVLIGTYNYDRSLADLKSKAANTADLAAISLAEPLWNYDQAALQGIMTAIFLDADIVGIRVIKPGKDKAEAEQVREGRGASSFEQLLGNPANVETSAKIEREGEVIATVQIVTSTHKVKALIRYTTMLISAFSVVFVLVLSVFIWILGKRIVQRPIDELKASADHLSHGELDYPINTTRKDELGSLAESFDLMRNAIRRKLSDLALLNSTGETMAGIHDQAEALKTAIRVMHQQTHVERGSIYLFDPAANTLKLHACYPELEDASQFPKAFHLSEGIAGRVATTLKTIFIPDVSTAPEYVPNQSGERPKALLCVPMMDDKTLFGVMNFVGDVGTVEFDAEDEGFALTIARMAVITTKNIQMLEVIEEHNRTLEEKILQRTAELRQKTNDVNAMLQNMRQGIFTIVGEEKIHPEHSAYLCEIFEMREVAGINACGFLFENSSVGGDTLAQVVAAIDSLIGEEAMNFEFNSHLLVHEYARNFPGGRTKILELDWNPVMGADDLIEKLMVTVRDVTELKALQRETEKQKEQLEIIGQILALSRDKLTEFLSTSYEFLDENEELIQKTKEKDLDVVAALFRNMHTVKGNARTYGLSYITDRVHEAESAYSLLRSQPEFEWNQAELLEQLNAARACIDRYDAVFREKLAGFTGGGIDVSLLERITEAIEGISESSHVSDLHSSIRKIRSSVNRLRHESIEETLKGIVAAMPSIARQLDKETPEIDIDDGGVFVKKDIVPMLRNVFMHVFRNTMDHGLESTEQRLAAGKPSAGRISLVVRRDQDQVSFAFSDDGRGLALKRIHDKAIANGQLRPDEPVTDEQVGELIFMSGLSTAEEVTNVSGRGVGMDAIRKFLHKHLGDVNIQFTGPRAESGFRPFRLLITLPSTQAVREER